MLMVAYGETAANLSKNPEITQNPEIAKRAKPSRFGNDLHTHSSLASLCSVLISQTILRTTTILYADTTSAVDSPTTRCSTTNCRFEDSRRATVGKGDVSSYVALDSHGMVLVPIILYLNVVFKRFVEVYEQNNHRWV